MVSGPTNCTEAQSAICRIEDQSQSIPRKVQTTLVLVRAKRDFILSLVAVWRVGA